MYLLKYNTATGTTTAGSMSPRRQIRKAGLADFAVSADWTPVAGDVQVSKDGGAFANIATLPAYTNGAWQYTLSAAELSCRTLDVRIVDSATKAVDDDDFRVDTFGHPNAMWPTGYEVFADSSGRVQVQYGISTGQIDASAGVVNVDVKKINGTTQTSGDAGQAANRILTALPTAAFNTSGGLHTIGTGAGQFLVDNAGLAAVRVVAMDNDTIDLLAIQDGAIRAGTIEANALNGKGDWLLASSYTAPLSASGTRSAIGLASANLDTQFSVIAGYVDTLETRIPATINVTDLNNATSRFLTMIVLAGSVYQYTANALELAPAGGGGTADWTADERTAIRAILGVPGSGTTPVTPTTGMLDTINDNIASLSAGSGSGAFVVTITVTDGTNPLQNAIVRLTEGANTFRATTNASGVATFSLNAATYTRSITRDGYTFTPNALAVSGATSSTSAMTATTIPPPADPDGCTVTIRARTQQLVPQAGVIIGFRYISLPAGSGMALPINPLLITTDANGDAQAELLQGAVVAVWRGREPALKGPSQIFTVPATATHTLQDQLGEDAT